MLDYAARIYERIVSAGAKAKKSGSVPEAVGLNVQKTLFENFKNNKFNSQHFVLYAFATSRLKCKRLIAEKFWAKGTLLSDVPSLSNVYLFEKFS